MNPPARSGLFSAPAAGALTSRTVGGRIFLIGWAMNLAAIVGAVVGFLVGEWRVPEDDLSEFGILVYAAVGAGIGAGVVLLVALSAAMASFLRDRGS